MEIGLLVLSGKTIGIWPTVILIILTGVVGAALAKKEGLETLLKAQEQMRHGKVPGTAILDGICILIGGIFLLTPGFISDTLGFLLLFPMTRKTFKPLILFFLKKMLDNGNFIIFRK